MKKTLIYGLLLIFLMPSCRKGDEDPFLSLRTRKNRLTGNWKLESYEVSKSFGSVRSIKYDKEANEIEYIYEDSTAEVRSYSRFMEFSNNGSYTITEEERFSVDTVEVPFSYTLNSTEKGDWEFTGGNGEPSKSQLLLLPREINRSRSNEGSNVEVTIIEGPVNGELFSIDRLSNKELKLSYELIKRLAFNEEIESLEMTFVKSEDGVDSD
ncbi:MAG: hypothetical protein WEC59_11700 [Salibacteraceae bacterium]